MAVPKYRQGILGFVVVIQLHCRPNLAHEWKCCGRSPWEAPPTQQEGVQGQHGGQVRWGLGDDEVHQVGVEAGQSVQSSGHHPPHGVAHQHHTLGGGLQVLVEEETEEKRDERLKLGQT